MRQAVGRSVSGAKLKTKGDERRLAVKNQKKQRRRHNVSVTCISRQQSCSEGLKPVELSWLTPLHANISWAIFSFLCRFNRRQTLSSMKTHRVCVAFQVLQTVWGKKKNPQSALFTSHSLSAVLLKFHDCRRKGSAMIKAARLHPHSPRTCGSSSLWSSHRQQCSFINHSA